MNISVSVDPRARPTSIRPSVFSAPKMLSGSGFKRSLSVAAAPGERHDEASPVRVGVLVLEAPAKGIRVGAGDREPQARAGHARAAGVVAVAEALEEVRDELRRYALAAVLDHEPEGLAALSAHLDRRRAVAEGVQDQVRRDALEGDRGGDELDPGIDVDPHVVAAAVGDAGQQLVEPRSRGQNRSG